jgi:uncharacterized protein (DUF1697 family)
MRLVAFLRGINVGGHVVKMDALKRHFESLGLDDVETFIASGNVVFSARASSPALERKIEAKLLASLGYEVRTFVRTAAEVAAVDRYKPFPESQIRGAHALYVGFLPEKVSAAAAKAVAALGTDVDLLHAHGRELYWLCGVSISETKLSYSALEKVLKASATFRNINTVTRLVKKFGFVAER